MRVNRLTPADATLPRNLRRVLMGVRKPLRPEEHRLLNARLDAEEKARIDAAKARAAAKAVA